ncbi:hypothetical protein HMPREF1144_5131 [Klebsiella sp. OBRC7]|nr:hypothetical protein HMPREF1144_5131 [Klebsiella sp. OBRC7]
MAGITSIKSTPSKIINSIIAFFFFAHYYRPITPLFINGMKP